MSVPPSTDDVEFEHLYRQWWSEVVSFCGRLLERADEAEDAAQDAFLRAWIARDRYSPVLPFWPWVATIARRQCLDRRRRPPAASLDELEDEEIVDTPEHVVMAGDDLRLALQVVDGMRPLERHALVRRELDGWSYGDIAAMEGVTVEAVRASLRRARASLRRSMSEGVILGPQPTGHLLSGRREGRSATR